MQLRLSIGGAASDFSAIVECTIQLDKDSTTATRREGIAVTETLKTQTSRIEIKG